MKAKLTSYLIRPLPLRTKSAAILAPDVVEELRLACNGQWQFLASQLQERRWDEEDQAAPLRPQLNRALSKFVASYQLDWSSAVREFEYNLAVAFHRAADQQKRWLHTKWLCRQIGSFCDHGRLNSILIWKRDYAVGGEASKA